MTGPPSESIVPRAAKATFGAVLVLIAFAAAWASRSVLLLVLVALVLAIGLDPAIRFLERHLKMRRGWAVTTIVLSGIVVVVLFMILLIPPMVREIQNFAKDIPGYIERLKDSNGFIGSLEDKYHLSQRLQKLTSDLPSLLSGSFSTIFGVTKSLATTIFNSLTIFVLTIYFMGSLPRMRDATAAIFSPRKHERYTAALDTSVEKIGGYVSGNITISIIAGVASFVFLLIAGVPFAAALAMWVAFADLIPSVGATLGAALCVLVAFFSGVTTGIITIVFFVIYQQVENYLISPRIMKKAVDLSPAAVIIAVLVGASLLGFVGALLALPIAAAAKVVIRDLWLGDKIADIRKARTA